jgi:hypothetical protein
MITCKFTWKYSLLQEYCAELIEETSTFYHLKIQGSLLDGQKVRLFKSEQGKVFAITINRTETTTNQMHQKQLSTFLKAVIPDKKNVMIASAPGYGKTSIVNQTAISIGADVIPMFPAISDPTDAKGLPWVVDGVPRFVPFDKLKRLIDATRTTICFLDDFGQAPTSVQASFMQLIYSRTVDGTPISPHVCFLAATNRKTDKAGVFGIIEPVKSRFVTIIELQLSVDDWIEWATINNLHPDVISFVHTRPTLLTDFKPTTDLVNSPNPRTMEHLSYLHSKQFQGEIRFDVYAGAVGAGCATEFENFLQGGFVLPNLKALLANPDSEALPDSVSLLYVLIGQLSVRANKQNVGNILKIADRMPVELGNMLVQQCLDRNPLMTKTSEVVLWKQAKGI